MRRQRRWFFEGVGAAMKALKKNGAHPDVFKGKYPEASAVNEVGLPTLERFLDDYGKAAGGQPAAAAQEITLCLKAPHAPRGVEKVTVVVSLAWPRHRVLAALRRFFEAVDFEPSDGSPLPEVLSASAERQPTVREHLARHAAHAKKVQQERRELSLRIRAAEADLRHLYDVAASLKPAAPGGADEVPRDLYLRCLRFLKVYLRSRKMGNRSVAVEVAGWGRPAIGYTAAPGGGVDELGVVVLSTRDVDVAADGEGEWDFRGFAGWKHLLDRVDWPRLEAAHRYKTSVITRFWAGVDAATRKLAAEVGVHSVECRSVGPILDRTLLKKADLAAARAAAGSRTTGHDFVAAVAALRKNSAAISSRLPPPELYGSLLARHVKVSLRPSLDADGAAVVAAERDHLVLHDGTLVIAVDPGRTAAISDQLAGALNRSALLSGVSSSRWVETRAVAERLARQHQIIVDPDPVWMVASEDFLGEYHHAVSLVGSCCGKLLALGAHSIALTVSDHFAFDSATGELRIAWNADFHTLQTHLPHSYDHRLTSG
ncbi:hypothetical protein DIPPA_17265 [Diplonema papillatum]|nr:hypothetical protein DIPPA_17265 [Diplonema papillatum]